MADGEPLEFEFELFVAGRRAETRALTAAVVAALDQEVPGRYRLTAVDVLERPEAALAAKVFATPMLIRRRPLPPARVLGDLRNAERLLRLLGIEPGQR